MGEQKTPQPPRKEAQLTKRKSFRISPELQERLRNSAAFDGRTVDEAVRFAIMEYCRAVESRYPAQPMSKGTDDDQAKRKAKKTE